MIKLEIQQKETAKLCLLTIFLAIFSLFVVLTRGMIFWLVLVAVISITYVVKYRDKIRKKDVFIGIILSILVIISNPLLGGLVLLSYLASVCIMKDKVQGIVFYNNKSIQHIFLATVLCIVFGGGVLSAINFLLAQQSYTVSISFQLTHLLNALQAGVFEEIAYRMFIFSLCVEILPNNNTHTRIQTVLCYIAMIVPHVLMHFSGQIQIEDFLTIAILSMLFGLPFSIMQRKLNLISAIAAHTLVDLVRFICFGV